MVIKWLGIPREPFIQLSGEEKRQLEIEGAEPVKDWLKRFLYQSIAPEIYVYAYDVEAKEAIDGYYRSGTQEAE